MDARKQIDPIKMWVGFSISLIIGIILSLTLNTNVMFTTVGVYILLIVLASLLPKKPFRTRRDRLEDEKY